MIYVGVILCLQGMAPDSAMQNNAADIPAYESARLRLHGPGAEE